MIQTCKCGKDFLTEADPYAIVPAENYAANCGCVFTGKLVDLLKAANRLLESVDPEEYYSTDELIAWQARIKKLGLTSSPI